MLYPLSYEGGSALCSESAKPTAELRERRSC
jgi:hypothetical protein